MASRGVRIGTAAAIVLLLTVAAVGLLGRGPEPVDRAYELEQRLRCPVCTSVSIAESGSDTAMAMRQVITEQIAAGRSDAEIVDYFRARYGDWVLLDPPARGSTTLVWLLPAAAALLGVVLVLTRRRPDPAPAPSRSDRTRLEELRDQALRDLVDLERQVTEGEIPPDVAADLRGRYESTAAGALVALDAPQQEPATEPVAAGRSRVRLAYGVAALVAVLAAAVVLPHSVAERPAGGFVTGNEIGQAAPGPLTRDPATIGDGELEAVVAANPGLLGMRLALAERYTERGDYERAAEHYTEALRREPADPRAQAGFGWLLLQIGRPVEAMEWVDRALAAPQVPLEALWFKANIELHGLDDPTAALATLDRMRQRGDVPPTVREQVDELAAVARQRQSGEGP